MLNQKMFTIDDNFMNDATELQDILKLRKKCKENGYIYFEKRVPLDDAYIEELAKQYVLIVYLRVSTQKQADKGYSMSGQLDSCLSYALSERAKSIDSNHEDLQVVVFSEPAIMGDNFTKPSMEFAIELMERGVGTHFLVLNQSRLTRAGHDDASRTRDYITEEVGIALHLVEQIGEFDPTNDEHHLNSDINAIMDKQYKRKMKKASRMGRMQKAREGKIPSPKPMFGYDIDKEKDIYVINEKEAEAIKWMVKMYLEENMTLHEITRIIATKYDPPITKTKKFKKSPTAKKVWYPNTISRMLRSETYTGTFWYGKQEIVQKKGKKIRLDRDRKVWIPIKVPVIITKEEQEKINDMCKENKEKYSGRKSEHYLLKGLVFCGVCGASASGIKSREYVYYSCSNKRKKQYEALKEKGTLVNKCTSKRNFRQDEIDEKLWNFLNNQLKNPTAFIESIQLEMQNNSEADKLKEDIILFTKKVSDIEEQIERLVETYQMGLLTKDKLDFKSKPLVSSKSEIENQIKIAESKLKLTENKVNKSEELEKALVKFSQYFLGKSDKISIEEKRAYVRKFVEKVVLNDDGHMEVYTTFNLNDISTDESGVYDSNTSAPSYSNCNTHQPSRYSFYNKVNVGTHAIQLASWINKAYENKAFYKNEITKLHQEELWSIAEIVRYYDTNHKALTKFMKETGIEQYSLKDYNRLKRKKHLELLYNARYIYKFTFEEIKKKYGISQFTAQLTLRENGHDPLSFSTKIAEINKQNTKVSKEQIEEIINRYNKGESIRSLAKEFGYADHSSVSRLIKRHGGEVRYSKFGIETEKKICADYEKGFGQYLLAKKYDFDSAGSINKILKRHNVETRNPKRHMEMIESGKIKAPVFMKFKKRKEKGFKLDIAKVKEEEIESMFLDEEIPATYISQLFNISTNKFYQIRKDIGLVKATNKQKNLSLIKANRK